MEKAAKATSTAVGKAATELGKRAKGRKIIGYARGGKPVYGEEEEPGTSATEPAGPEEET